MRAHEEQGGKIIRKFIEHGHFRKHFKQFFFYEVPRKRKNSKLPEANEAMSFRKIHCPVVVEC